MSLNALFFTLFIIFIITNRLEIFMLWYKMLYNNEMSEEEGFISFYFRKGCSPFSYVSFFPCLILHPKDNTPETLSLVKRFNIIAIIISILNLVFFGIVIFIMATVRK